VVQRRVGNRLPASVVIAGAMLAGSLAACSNGVEAGTLDPPSATGVNYDLGDLRIRNAVVVAEENGGLTVSMTVVNTGSSEDAVTDLTLTGEEEPVEADLSPRSITLAPGVATVIPGESRPSIEVDLDLQAGGYVPVTVQFENAGRAALSLPVITPSSPQAGGSD